MSTSPTIIVFPRGQLTPEDKATLNSAGIVGIEADDPGQVKQVQLHAATVACSSISGDAIVRAALAALTSQPAHNGSDLINDLGKAQGVFLRVLRDAIKPAEDGAPAP